MIKNRFALDIIQKRIMEKNSETVFQDYSDYSDVRNYCDYGDSNGDWT